MSGWVNALLSIIVVCVSVDIEKVTGKEGSDYVGSEEKAVCSG